MDVQDETSGQKMVSRETRMFEVVQQERPPRRLPLESACEAVNHGGPDPWADYHARQLADNAGSRWEGCWDCWDWNNHDWRGQAAESEPRTRDKDL